MSVFVNRCSHPCTSYEEPHILGVEKIEHDHIDPDRTWILLIAILEDSVFQIKNDLSPCESGVRSLLVNLTVARRDLFMFRQDKLN